MPVHVGYSKLNAMHKSDVGEQKQSEAEHKIVTLTLRWSKQSESWWVRSNYSPAAVWCPHTGAAAACDRHSQKIDPTQTLTRGLHGGRDVGKQNLRCHAYIRVTVKLKE